MRGAWGAVVGRAGGRGGEGSVTLCGSWGAHRGGAPVVEGTAHHGVLAGLQHHVTVDKFFDSSLAVGQQAAQAQAATAAEGGSEHQDAQVEEVAVCRVCTPAARPGRGHGQHPQAHSLPLPPPTHPPALPTHPTQCSSPTLSPPWPTAAPTCCPPGRGQTPGTHAPAR